MKTLAIILPFITAALSAPVLPSPFANPWSFPYLYPHAYPYASYVAAKPEQVLLKSAAPVAAPAYVPAVYAPAYTSSQYHSQDELGAASFGYAHPGQSHAAVRDAFGNVQGSYAYINPEGKEVRVNYIADAGGFRVASNDLPVAPSEQAVELPVAPQPVDFTPEVKAARDEHLKAVAEAKARNLALGDDTSSRRKREALEPVDFTPEVKAARAEHFKAIEEAKARNALQDAIDATKFFYRFPYVTPYAHPYAGFPVAYNYAPAVSSTIVTPTHSFAYRVDV